MALVIVKHVYSSPRYFKKYYGCIITYNLNKILSLIKTFKKFVIYLRFKYITFKKLSWIKWI